MRFLLMFIKILGGLAAMATIVVFGYLDGSLHLAARQVRKDMSQTRLMLTDREHANKCNQQVEELEFTVTDQVSPFRGYRMRFVNDRDYVIEAVCATSGAGPFEVATKTLPFGVRKVAGSGVMVMANTGSASRLESRVLLQKEFRSLATGYYEGALTWKYEKSDGWEDFGLNAAETTCEGWGYECCIGQVQVGVGEGFNDTLDCRGACYTTCKERPFVVYFNTNPVMDRNTRVLMVQGTEVEVGIGYEVTDADGEVERVKLDYGDGQQDIFRASNIVNHRYVCARTQCLFTATLSATDDEGLELAETSLNKIQIVVSN